MLQCTVGRKQIRIGLAYVTSEEGDGMSKIISALFAFCAIPVAIASTQVSIKKGALICYERADWEGMVAAITDTNVQAMRALLESGKCQKSLKQMTATYLDPARGNAALIQMPSGRTAFVFDVDIRR